jgi:hypothetical protein
MSEQKNSDASWEQIRAQADALVAEMEAAGYTVKVDEHAVAAGVRVRVSRKVGRRTVYNAHTYATSGYANAVARAYDKWRQHREAEAQA